MIVCDVHGLELPVYQGTDGNGLIIERVRPCPECVRSRFVLKPPQRGGYVGPAHPAPPTPQQIPHPLPKAHGGAASAPRAEATVTQVKDPSPRCAGCGAPLPRPKPGRKPRRFCERCW